MKVLTIVSVATDAASHRAGRDEFEYEPDSSRIRHQGLGKSADSFPVP